ncbi:hypothetical protein LPJ57_007130, partial [Coemansia sp. RSA 486]
RDAQQRLIALALEQTKDANERAYLAAVLEDERRQLELTSVRAMAVLCRRDGILAAEAQAPGDAKLLETGGPREKVILFAWVSDALNHYSARVQLVGQRAVEWTVRSDPADAAMMRVLVQLSYGMPVTNSVENGFGSASPDPAASATGAGGSGASVGAADGSGTGAASASAAGSNSASGLGLMFGSGDVPANRTSSIRHGSGATAMAKGFSVTSDRVILGYLRALAAIISPWSSSPSSNDINNGMSTRGRDTLQGRLLTQRYAGWLLPLILLHLRSDQPRVRRQALVLLRTMCLHLSVDISCVYCVDEMGPSIVSDIPAIASKAAAGLTEAVALAFAGHSVSVLMETVRQIHAHSVYGPQLTTFLGLARPWLVNVVLRRQTDALATVDNDDGSPDGLACLDPVALSRESLLVLQCMLYMTIKTGHDSMSSMQELWLALSGSSNDKEREANVWLIIRYLTGLLVHSRSNALLGFMRRISVFLTRSLQGPRLVQMLADETMRPSAAVPLGVTDIPARNIAAGMVAGERWAAEILFISQQHQHQQHLAHHQGRGRNVYRQQSHQHQQQPQQRHLLVSTGGLAMFYLGAISYEQPDALAAYQSLAVLPSTIVLLASPEKWVRDAARTVLVNLVASERARCTRACLASDSASATDQGVVVQANDAAHVVLGVLRGDECMTGFGNLDDDNLHGTHDQAAVQKGRHSQIHHRDERRQDSQFGDDDDESALHGWSPVSINAADYMESGSLGAHRAQADQDGSQLHQNQSQLKETHPDNQQQLLESSNSNGSIGGGSSVRTAGSTIDAADPSVVADVAGFAVAIPPQSGSEAGPTGTGRGAKLSSSADASDPVSIRRRSSAVSRRSFNAEYAGDVGSKDRATLQRFVVQMSRLFSRNYSGCAQEWADVAVQWAMSCPVRPLAGLALQVFSALAMEAQYGGAV